MVRRDESCVALPIMDERVAQLYKDLGWEVERWHVNRLGLSARVILKRR